MDAMYQSGTNSIGRVTIMMNGSDIPRIRTIHVCAGTFRQESVTAARNRRDGKSIAQVSRCGAYRGPVTAIAPGAVCAIAGPPERPGDRHARDKTPERPLGDCLPCRSRHALLACALNTAAVA